MLEVKLDRTQLSQIRPRLEFKLAAFRKPEIELKFDLELYLLKASL